MSSKTFKFLQIKSMCAAIIVTLTTVNVSYSSDLFECDDETVKEERCNNGSCQLILFYRDCGATASISTIVELRNVGLFNGNKIIFTANKKLDIDFLFVGKNELTLRFKEDLDSLSKNIFIKETEFKNIRIHYAFAVRH